MERRGVGLKAVLLLGLVFFCGFAGARLGFESAIDEKVAALGSRVKLSDGEAINFFNAEDETLFSMKNFNGRGHLSFYVDGEQAFTIRSEDGKLRIKFMDGLKTGGLLSFSPDEGIKFIDVDKEGRDRFYFATQSDNPGIMFFNLGEDNKAAAALGVQKKSGGSGRLFLATPDYAGKVTGGFTAGGAPQFKLSTDDGATILMEIIDGEPALILQNKEGKEKRITP
jgi:hypothetical protein